MRRSVKGPASGGARSGKSARNDSAPVNEGVNQGANDAVTLARYYDLDVSTEVEDVEMLLALAAATDDPILELACGTGRVCVPLAAAGHRVTGVDIDPHMLHRAEQAWNARRGTTRRGALELLEADMTTLRLDQRFGLVIIALNSLLLLTDGAAQAAALHVMAAHLAPDGRAVIDVWLPAPEDLELYDGRLIQDWVRVDKTTGQWVAKSTAARYSPASAEASILTFFDSWTQSEPMRRTYRSDTINFVTRSELISMAEAAGLEPQIVAGDHSMAEFGPDSERIVLVARRAEKRQHAGTP